MVANDTNAGPRYKIAPLPSCPLEKLGDPWIRSCWECFAYKLLLIVIHLSPDSQPTLTHFWTLGLKWRAKRAVTCLTWLNEGLSLFLTWLFLEFAWLCTVELCFSSPGFFLCKFFSCELFLVRWDLQGGVDIAFQGLLLLLHWLYWHHIPWGQISGLRASI